MKLVTLTIDGIKTQAEDQALLIEVARKAGVKIPSLCHHPQLEPYGVCRVCSVEVKVGDKVNVVTSCRYPVTDGLEVYTQTERIRSLRKGLLEKQLAHSGHVPVLNAMAAEYGVADPPPLGRGDDRCIVCGRCVRACHEVAKKDVMQFVGRGSARTVSTETGTYNAEACDDCNKCIPFCPTGAITQLPNLPIGRKFYEGTKKWMNIRRQAQYALLALFTFFFFTTSLKWWGNATTVNLFSVLDPLQAIGSSIAARRPIWLFYPALLTIAATFVFGRVWCGWVCPLGVILDLFGPNGTRKVAGWWRQIKYGVLFVVLMMAVFGSLAFMWFDPITVLVRGVADPIAVVKSIIALRRTQYNTLVQYITLLSILPLAAILALNFVEKRFWCRYFCPLGAIVALGSKASWIRRVVGDSCVTCGDCVPSCSMGAINPKTIKSDPAECIMCMDCATPCPMTTITFEKKPTPLWKHEFDPTRREVLGSAATSAAGLALFSTGLAKSQSADLLRPPGVAAKEAAFLTECIRCGQCVQACPGQTLHPAWLGMSWDSFWTPALVGSLGGCQFDCNRCGPVCPSGAIPNLSLEEKRKQIIGLAVVDEELCINCMICMKTCPYKAIEEVTVRKAKTRKPLPVVLADKCNGCALCEFACPVPPSIKVFALGRAPKGGTMLQRV